MPTAVPAFGQTLKTVYAKLSTAKTTYADLTNAVQMTALNANYAVPANGALLVKCWALPIATVTSAAQIILWGLQASGTASTGLMPLASAAMATYSLAQTTALPQTALLDGNGDSISDQNPMYLEAGLVLYGSTGQSQAAFLMAQIVEL